MKVRLDAVTKRYDAATTAVDAVDVTFPSATTTVVVGRSGSGKSTLLNLVAGLLRPTRGHVVFGDRDVTDVPPERRNVGFVFQSYALFPHLTVEENVGFGPASAKLPRGRRREVVERFLYDRICVAVPFDRIADVYRLVSPPGIVLAGEAYGEVNEFSFDVRQSLRDEFLRMLAARRLTPR